MNLLEVKNLTIEFSDTSVPTRVVDRLSFSMKEGEILGIVGESGSGKTQTALAVSGLLKSSAGMQNGEILFSGKNLLDCSRKEMEAIRGKDISMIFQEPMTCLNPVMTIGEQVEEALKIHTSLSGKERRELALSRMEQTELPLPGELYQKYPHQLSGGMRQRVMIAAALILHPRLLIADEPTTALDVTIQAQILKLLAKINKEQGTGILFISHDLGVVRRLCHRILVMHQGRLVEEGTAEELFAHPKEEYTKNLLESIPGRNRSLRRRQKEGSHEANT